MATGRRTCGSTARPVLARRADGRDGTADSPRRSRGARWRDRHGRTRRAVADGAPGRRLSRAQRSRQSAGPLGGATGIRAVHRCDRDRGAPRRRRSRRRGVELDRGRLSARDRRRMEREHRPMALRAREPSSRSCTASTATTRASRRRITPTPPRRVTGLSRSRTALRIKRPGRPR